MGFNINNYIATNDQLVAIYQVATDLLNSGHTKNQILSGAIRSMEVAEGVINTGTTVNVTGTLAGDTAPTNIDITVDNAGNILTESQSMYLAVLIIDYIEGGTLYTNESPTISSDRMDSLVDIINDGLATLGQDMPAINPDESEELELESPKEILTYDDKLDGNLKINIDRWYS